MSIEVDDDNMPDISPVSIDVGSVDTAQSTSFSFARSYNTIDSSDKTLKKLTILPIRSRLMPSTRQSSSDERTLQWQRQPKSFLPKRRPKPELTSSART
jgi:hypothetical protein